MNNENNKHKIYKNSLRKPLFCPHCKDLRKKSPTILTGFDNMTWNASGMCSNCLEFVNDIDNKEIVDAYEMTLEGQEQESEM